MTTVNNSASTVNLGAENILGVVVSWDYGIISDANCLHINRGVLTEMLMSLGFEASQFIDHPNYDDALVRAHREVQWGTRCGLKNAVQIVRLNADSSASKSFGVLVTKAVETETAVAQIGARVRATGSGFQVLDPIDGDPDVEAMTVAHAIAEYADNLASTATNSDITKLLSTMRKKLGTISMRRNGGGVYFLPNGHEAVRFVQLLDNLEKLTAFEKPENRFFSHVTVIHRDERNLATWSRNASMEFSEEIDALVKELNEMTSRDNVRDSSWDKKKLECLGLMMKADRYAVLLASNLDAIKSKLGSLEAEFGNAQAIASENVSAAKRNFERLGLVSQEKQEMKLKNEETANQALKALDAFALLNQI